MSLVLISGMFLCADASENVSDTAQEEVINIVKLLEIMNGNENGELNLDKNVTRAEFVKMLTNASAYKNEALAGTDISPFPDVGFSHWAAKYILCASKNGIANGYLDGTFRPSNNVKLEEAVTMTLKLLGYGEADFKTSYPAGQLSKYTELKLDKNIKAKAGDYMTRLDCAYLIYNMLSTESKTGTPYIKTIGYSADGDGKVDYLKLLEDKMEGPVTVDNAGPWRSKVKILPENAEVYIDGKLSKSENLKVNNVVYYCEEINTIWAYTDKVTGLCTEVLPDKNSPSKVVVGGKTYTLGNSNVSQKFSVLGSLGEDNVVVLLFGKDGNVADAFMGDISDYELYSDGELDYAYLVESTIKGPVIVNDLSSWKDKLGFDYANAVCYKRSKNVSISDVSLYDVVYYSSVFNTIWIYDDKISGTVEEILPDKSMPTSVVISGKTLSLETASCEFDFSSMGKYNVGDTVTVLLGRNGLAAGVKSVADINKERFGIALSVGEKKYKNSDGSEYSSYYVEVSDFEGGTYEYKTQSKDFPTEYIVSVTFRNGSQKVSSIKENYTDISKLKDAVKNKKYSSDAVIVDLCGKTFTKVFPSSISNVSLSTEDVLLYRMNAGGEITYLVLSDVTGDLYSYGIITASSESTSSKIMSSYTFLEKDSVKTIKSEDTAFLAKTGPAKVLIENGSVKKISNLNFVKADSASMLQITSGGKTYDIWDKVSAYLYENDEYKNIKLSDACNLDKYNLKCYYDASGKIRIIVALKNYSAK